MLFSEARTRLDYARRLIDYVLSGPMVMRLAKADFQKLIDRDWPYYGWLEQMTELDTVTVLKAPLAVVNDQFLSYRLAIGRSVARRLTVIPDKITCFGIFYKRFKMADNSWTPPLIVVSNQSQATFKSTFSHELTHYFQSLRLFYDQDWRFRGNFVGAGEIQPSELEWQKLQSIFGKIDNQTCIKLTDKLNDINSLKYMFDLSEIEAYTLSDMIPEMRRLIHRQAVSKSKWYMEYQPGFFKSIQKLSRKDAQVACARRFCDNFLLSPNQFRSLSEKSYSFIRNVIRQKFNLFEHEFLMSGLPSIIIKYYAAGLVGRFDIVRLVNQAVAEAFEIESERLIT